MYLPIQNKYYKWYCNIITKASQRNSCEYYEKHHIIPECFFVDSKRNTKKDGWMEGNPEDNNIILLTPKEHYVCHWLLTKFYEGIAYYKMMWAFWGMNGWKNSKQNRYISAKGYEISKKLFGEEHSKRIQGNNNPNYGNHALAGKNNPNYGKKHTESTKLFCKLAAIAQSNTCKGKIWINNNIKRTRINPSNIFEYQKLGYHVGWALL